MFNYRVIRTLVLIACVTNPMQYMWQMYTQRFFPAKVLRIKIEMVQGIMTEFSLF